MSGFETRAIHAGQDPDPASGAIIPPITTSTTFIQDGVGNMRAGYLYSRVANPTTAALETQVASLEDAKHGFAFASGQAAEDAVLRQLPADSHVVIPSDVYGGTFRLLDKIFRPHDLDYTATDCSDETALDSVWRDNTRVLWIESPTNPRLDIVDIAKAAAYAHERGALCVVDNTFASPYLQQPLSLGADVVLHSMTKYLGGHSDITAGFVGVNDDALAEGLFFHKKSVGAILSPFDAYMTTRGVKTLAVRMERHCDNAEEVVAMLVEHPSVERVFYPGLPSHPGHEIARKQMRRFGGMVSFDTRGGEAAALEMLSHTKLFALGESLGGVESLIEHPGRMTHASAVGSPTEVDPALVRVSVGIETADDLVADLRQALDSIG